MANCLPFSIVSSLPGKHSVCRRVRGCRDTSQLREKAFEPSRRKFLRQIDTERNGTERFRSRSSLGPFGELWGEVGVLDAIEQELEDLKVVSTRTQTVLGQFQPDELQEGDEAVSNRSADAKGSSLAPVLSAANREVRLEALVRLEAEMEAADLELYAKQRALNKLLETVAQGIEASSAASAASAQAESSMRSAENAMEEAMVATTFLRSATGAKEVGTRFWEALGNKAAASSSYASLAWLKAERDAASLAVARLVDEAKAAEVESLRKLSSAAFQGRYQKSFENARWLEGMRAPKAADGEE